MTDAVTRLFTYLLVYLKCSPPWSLGNVRSGMSRSRQFWIRQLSHLAAWFIWVALWVLYMALKLSLLSTLFTSVPVLNHTYAEEVSPRIQPAMLHS